eukprot:GILJ01001969.1.p1 GENE.GILJ01001969.1~~GILJ01001969.1.p1  ORF type:complete len:571 (+),score=93.47 GILJ01001969.1:187-1899(+)
MPFVSTKSSTSTWGVRRTRAPMPVIKNPRSLLYVDSSPKAGTATATSKSRVGAARLTDSPFSATAPPVELKPKRSSSRRLEDLTKTSADVDTDDIESPVAKGEVKVDLSLEALEVTDAVSSISFEFLAERENILWSLLEGLRTMADSASPCHSWWDTVSGHPVFAEMEQLFKDDKTSKLVRTANVLEVVSITLTFFLSSDKRTSASSRCHLRNLLFYVHQNCILQLEILLMRVLTTGNQTPCLTDLDKTVRARRARKFKKSELLTALKQNNEMIINAIRQACRSPGIRLPSSRKLGPAAMVSPMEAQNFRSLIQLVTSLTRQLDRVLLTRARDLLSPYYLSKQALDMMSIIPSLPVPFLPSQVVVSPLVHLGVAYPTAGTGPSLLPPLSSSSSSSSSSKLPPREYSLVLDLDETLVHYFENARGGHFLVRPGVHEFLETLSQFYEVIVFTAATQDYADWVLNQIDPKGFISHRLYRQHAVPWGPIYLKDLARLGRDLTKIMIVDNVAENFQLQPENGILIRPWFDDMKDTALFELLPVLQGIVESKTPDIRINLKKLREEILKQGGVHLR